MIHAIKNALNPCLPGIMSIFFNVDFCMPIFLQYLLISWFWLFLSNSFNILWLFTEFHLLKFTFKDFTGLSLLQITEQIWNSMPIFALLELTSHRTANCSLPIAYFVHINQMWGSFRPLASIKFHQDFYKISFLSSL